MWDAGLAAIAQIEDIVAREALDAGFGVVTAAICALDIYALLAWPIP